MMQKIKELSDKMKNIFKPVAYNIISFLELIKIAIFSLKDDMVLFLKVFLLSVMAFAGITCISSVFYSFVIILIWFILLLELSFEIGKNKTRIEEFLVSSFANVFAFLLWKIYGDKEYTSVQNIKLILILILYFAPLYIFSLKNIVFNKKNDEKFFPSRKADLKRALNYLDIKIIEKSGGEGGEDRIEKEDIDKKDTGRNILGIESPWGNGKTFFVQNLKDELGKEKYVFVEIDVLAYNLDELPKVLVKELGKVLYDNHIMSKYSSRLKDFFEKEKRLDILYKLFGGKQYSYAETFRGFKEELKRIDKTIFIIYEDIDRIIDRRLIKKIFYISEKLSCEKIKIVYQYSMNRLEKIGFDKAYVDKYIPSTIALTDTSLKEVRDNSRDDLKNVITDSDLSIFDSKSFFTKLSSNFYLRWRNDEQLIPKKKIHDFLQNRYNIRTIRHFFYDIKMMLESENIKTDIQRKTMIAFLFVQRFLPEAYKELKVRRNLEDCFLIKVEDKEYNFYDLHLFCTSINGVKTSKPVPFDVKILASTDGMAIERKRKVIEILDNPVNIEKYIAYYVLDYENYLEYIRDTGAGINDEKVDLYDQQNKIVWNLLSAGISLKGDYQRIVEEVKRSIFDRKTPSVEYSTFNFGILRRFDEEVDNWALYFAAFCTTGESEENWKKLIKLYWQRNSWKELSPAFIESAIGCMRYLDDKNFKYFMEKMNKLKIVGHLNKKKKTPEFLKSVLDRIYGDYLGLSEYRMNREKIIENILNQTELKVFADVCREIDMAIEVFEEQGVCRDLIHMGFVYKKTMKKMKQLVMEKDHYNDHKPRPKQQDENYHRLVTCSNEEIKSEIKVMKKEHSPGKILNLLRARKAKK